MVKIALASLFAVATPAMASATCGMQQYDGQSCVSDSYVHSKATDADACCALCSGEAQCAQWTFHSDKGKCYRTSSAVSPSTKDSSTCGIKGAGPSPPTPAPPAPSPPTPTPPAPSPPAPTPSSGITAPDTSMDTIPVGYFGGNQQARPKENLEMLSKMRLVVIEKWEGNCYNDCLTNSSQGIACDPACHQEDVELATLRAVKELNPKVAAAFYLNSWFDFKFYDLHRKMAEGGYLMVDHDTGKVASVENDNGMKDNNVFDFGQKGARDLWLQLVKDLVSTGYVDGIFADKYVIRASQSGKGSTGWSSCNGHKACVILTKEQALAYNDGKQELMDDTRKFLGDDALFWYSTTAQLKKVESKDPEDILKDYQDKKDQFKYLYMQTGDQHSNHDPSITTSQCDTDMIAKYMLVAERGVFLGCNGWDERFGYPLGEPTGPMQKQNGKLIRSFSSGTKVEWDSSAQKGSQATITWASTDVVV